MMCCYFNQTGRLAQLRCTKQAGGTTKLLHFTPGMLRAWMTLPFFVL
jgi:hypothetical protein